MRRALEEARKGVGRTAPNPPVGAVIVKEGREIGAGWHRRAGQPHAEREALADARTRVGAEAIRGATIFVTLEPCSTHGRTPPCVDGIREAGISRVVYAATDPNPAHAGRAEAALQSTGVAVTAGVLEAEALRLIRPFAKAMGTGLPWVIWKTAMSLDARLTRPPGEGMWLTRAAARARVQSLRAEVGAVVTSGATVRADRPRLDLRETQYLEGREMPWRIVVSDLPDSLPMNAPLFTDANRHRTRIVPAGDPEGMLRRLVSEDGVNAVLLECGGRMAGRWMDDGWIDEVVVFLAPLLCGGAVAPLEGKGFPAGLRLREAGFERCGMDVMLRALVDR
ncbi:riboflavin biosynthesis protein RibD [Haloferula sargassicola]|uniref:Riboflavin biosynthesis protein RibD n=2 Tax=Haloferula sargassicola TaxID=490096 RepID=A0ABP9ULN7_9BACT